MAELKAVFLNCTLKKSPAISHTEGLARKVIEWFDTMDVESEMVRVIEVGQLVAWIEDEALQAPMAGILRGLVHDGVKVKEGAKVVEIDPLRDAARSSASASGRAR